MGWTNPTEKYDKYACQIGSFPHGIEVKQPPMELLAWALLDADAEGPSGSQISQHHPSQCRKTQKSCGNFGFFCWEKKLMHKNRATETVGMVINYQKHFVTATFFKSWPRFGLRSDPLQKGLSDLGGTFQWSSFSVVGPKWSDFTPRSVLIPDKWVFLELFHPETWIL